jgi:hypothetical protein
MAKRDVLQFDLIQIDNSKIEYTPQGFMKIPANFTGVGVYPYRDANNPRKTVQRLRSEVEVFKPESMKTLMDAPYTKRHPPEMVTPDNVALYRKGHVSGEVRKVGSKLLGGFVIIEDKDAQEDIKNGIKQLSCGYMATIDDEGGEWKDNETGQVHHYDDQQVDITYNHVAGVPQGRQGPDKTLLLDRKEFYFQDGLEFDEPPTGESRGDAMKYQVKLLDGTTVEMEMDAATHEKLTKEIGKLHEDSKEHANKLRDAKTMCDDLQTKMDSEKEEKEKMKGQKDAAERELETLKKKHLDAADPKTISKLAAARQMKMAVLSQFLDSKDELAKLEDTTDLDLMKMVILADAKISEQPIELKDAKPEYVQGLYDAIERREKAAVLEGIQLGNFLVDNRENGKSSEEKGPLDPSNRKGGSAAHVDEEMTPTETDKKNAKDKKEKDYKDKQEMRHKDYKPAVSKK